MRYLFKKKLNWFFEHCCSWRQLYWSGLCMNSSRKPTEKVPRWYLLPGIYLFQYLLIKCISYTVHRLNVKKLVLLNKKRNEWGFRPPLSTYRLNWVRRTSWGWQDKWDDTALLTHDSKFDHGTSLTEHATSRSRRLPTILNVYEWVVKKHFVSLELEGQNGVWTRDLRLSKQAALTTARGSLPT